MVVVEGCIYFLFVVVVRGCEVVGGWSREPFC